jgi:excinuclease ABC subunit A
MDQSPIGKTPRSNPATYTGAFDTIRQLFASTPEARMRGYDAGTFSFNTPKGRCEACTGAGRIKLEMSFMPDTYIPCEACNGSRYSPEVLEVKWNGLNIAEVLNLSFEQALETFAFHSSLKALLQLMVDTGLGYLTLGQNSPSLSGGEAQRVKLVSELAKGLPGYKDQSRGKTRHNLYLLEEPTIGLHQKDCERLIHLLHELVGQGHSVLVIEHHSDLIAEADYVVEVGPGAGDEGGKLLFQGDLEHFLQSSQSPTAPYLAKPPVNKP